MARNARHGIGLIFEAFAGDILMAEEAMPIGAGIDPALGFKKAITFVFQSALVGQGHLLLLHRVQTGQATDRDIRGNGGGVFGQTLELNLNGFESRRDERAKGDLLVVIHSGSVRRETQMLVLAGKCGEVVLENQKFRNTRNI